MNGSRWPKEQDEKLVSEKQQTASSSASPAEPENSSAPAAETAERAAGQPEYFDLTRDGEEKMTIGRHAGKTFEEIREPYPKYCDWVVRTATEETEVSDVLRRLATYLLAAAADDAEML